VDNTEQEDTDDQELFNDQVQDSEQNYGLQELSAYDYDYEYQIRYVDIPSYYTYYDYYVIPIYETRYVYLDYPKYYLNVQYNIHPINYDNVYVTDYYYYN